MYEDTGAWQITGCNTWMWFESLPAVNGIIECSYIEGMQAPVIGGFKTPALLHQ